MTQEEKFLLLQDLCARLPYSTLCYCKWTKDAPNGTSGCVQEVSTYLLDELMIIDNLNYECQICEIKPYLRPMSSMAEEEYKELKKISNYYGFAPFEYIYDWEPNYKITDWLNAHYFDYRVLIEKSLALEAPEGMYNLKNK